MDLVQLLSERLGVSPEQAAQGAGMIFQKAKEKLSAGDFAKVADAIPGLEGMIDKAPSPESAKAGGLMGMLGSAASQFGMGQVGDLADLTAGFQKIGLDASNLQGFAKTILEFVERKLGPEAKAMIAKLLG